jgi:hypothetical protein
MDMASPKDSKWDGAPYYDIRAVLLNNREQTFASAIKDRHQAEWLVAQMSAAIGIK